MWTTRSNEVESGVLVLDDGARVNLLLEKLSFSFNEEAFFFSLKREDFFCFPILEEKLFFLFEKKGFLLLS